MCLHISDFGFFSHIHACSYCNISRLCTLWTVIHPRITVQLLYKRCLHTYTKVDLSGNLSVPCSSHAQTTRRINKLISSEFQANIYSTIVKSSDKILKICLDDENPHIISFILIYFLESKRNFKGGTYRGEIARWKHTE